MTIVRRWLATFAFVLVAASPAPTQVSPDAYAISGWRLECATQSSVLVCQVLDEVTLRANNAVVAAVSLTLSNDRKSSMITVQAPLGIALDAPAQVGFPGGATQTLPFVTCNRGGCFARAQAQEALLTEMRSAKQSLHVTYASLDQNFNKQNIAITLPTDGFAAAYEKLR